MGSSVVVDSVSFTDEVVQKSYEKPVLVDFFAQWCGPCQMLKPMLEKLVKEYDFVLAKVDIDQNPDLANAYGVEGVPDVRIVRDGEVQPGFVGVLPEPKLRELMQQLNLQSGLDDGLQVIQAAKTAGDLETVKRQFGELIQTYPDDRRLMLEAAHFLILQNSAESAEKLLSAIQESEKPYYAKAQALRSLLHLKQDMTATESQNELDERYFQAVTDTLKENYEAALQGFLSVVGRDRKYRQDGARKAMVMVFDLLGDDHPLTRSYRKQLMQTMY